MNFNFFIIPAVITIIVIMRIRYTKHGLRYWHEELNKPTWTPSTELIGEIWTFLYIVIGLAVLWYWNVPIFSWIHFVTAGVLIINAYLNATWNKVLFVDHNLSKASQRLNLIIITAVIATTLMAIASPIAAGLMLPYLVWLIIARNLSNKIIKMNHK